MNALPSTDEQLERYIDAAWRALNAAANELLKREAAQHMAELIAKRSPARIAEMERHAGLR